MQATVVDDPRLRYTALLRKANQVDGLQHQAEQGAPMFSF